MVVITPALSIITVNVNGLVHQIRQKMSEWIQMQNPTLCHLPETHFQYKQID